MRLLKHASSIEIDKYTLSYLKWITNKDLLYSTENSAQCYVAAWTGGEFGGEWIHVHVWLSPFAVHLKLSQHWLMAMKVQVKILAAQLCLTLCNQWTVARQAPLSMGFSRQEY